jgi:RNA polymerase sigma factor (sigma-70 family)
MERFCQGVVGAFDTLYARHAGALKGYLTRLTGTPSAADDVLQATFLSLVRARGRFRRGARLKPWLYAIATNAARDWRRRGSQEEAVPEEVQEEGAEMVVADPGLERRVRAALEALPEGTRLAILLHRFEGLSFSEVAEVLGVSETAAKVRAHRGYTRLRELLADLEEER